MIVRDIGVIFVIAGILGLVFKLAKQPMIPAFVLAGVISGPLCLGLVNHAEVTYDLSASRRSC